MEFNLIYFSQTGSSQLRINRLHSDNTVELIVTDRQQNGQFSFGGITLCTAGIQFAITRLFKISNVTLDLAGTYQLTDGNLAHNLTLTGK